MTKGKQQHGFTLIELLLAMGFVTALLLGIALTVVQVGRIYNKGVTVTELNQAGRSLTSEVNNAISQSGKFNIANHYRTNSTGGRLCTGQYSYLWNYADAVDSGEPNLTKYRTGEPVYFAKVLDTGQTLCTMSAVDPNAFARVTLTATETTNSSELLKAGERSIKVYKSDIVLAAGGTDALSGQELYVTSFTIGTGQARAVNDTKTACRPPSDPASDPAYCSVQQFEFVIRAGNGVS